MAESTEGTVLLHGWLDRMRAGDLAARDELLRNLGGRLERLTRKMVRHFPGVQRWADADDVLQNSLLRLLRSLEQVKPGSMRDFYGLAAEQVRRELLDLTRHFYGPLGHGTNQIGQGPKSDLFYETEEPSDRANDRDELERWCAFHEGVASLPTEEREVVGLVYYHGWSQAAVAELFGVTVRTVQRRWQSALEKLNQVCNDEVLEK